MVIIHLELTLPMNAVSGQQKKNKERKYVKLNAEC